MRALFIVGIAFQFIDLDNGHSPTEQKVNKSEQPTPYKGGNQIREKMDQDPYDVLLDEEAEHWGKEFKKMLKAGIKPDLRVPFRKFGAIASWDDSKVDFLLRGKYLRIILDVCSTRPGKYCLELCCGFGALSLEAARRGANVIGIDVSPEAIQIGTDYKAGLDERIPGELSFEIGDLNTLELPNKRYDVVFVWDGLHHIASLGHLVSEVKKTLKDDGLFLVHDHVSAPSWSAKLSLAMAGLLFLVLPTEDAFPDKIRYICKNLKHPSAKELSSPFEDVGAKRIVECIDATLEVVMLQKYLTFSHYIVARIRPNLPNRFSLIRFIIRLDTALSKILRPEYVFLIAKKRNSTS